MKTVERVFKEGDPKCQHQWLTNKIDLSNTTTVRSACTKCGRVIVSETKK